MKRRDFIAAASAFLLPSTALSSSETKQYGLMMEVDSIEEISRAQLQLHAKAVAIASKKGKRIFLDTCEWVVLPPYQGSDDPYGQRGYVGMKWMM